MTARKTVRYFLTIQLSRAELAQELVHAFAGLGSVLSLPLWCGSEAKELFIGWGPDFFSPLLALFFKLHVSNIPFLFFCKMVYSVEVSFCSRTVNHVRE